MTENEFKFVESAVKWMVVLGIWSLAANAGLGAYALGCLVF